MVYLFNLLLVSSVAITTEDYQAVGPPAVIPPSHLTGSRVATTKESYVLHGSSKLSGSRGLNRVSAGSLLSVIP